MSQQPVPERLQISPFLVLYLIMSMQIGIGVLGYQRIIAEAAGYDAWISVLGAGLSIHIIIWMIYKICGTVDGDIVAANAYVFGKKIGNLVSSFFIIYLLIFALAVLRTFIEVIQVWMFPELSIFWFSLVFLILAVYIVFGGFRTVTGIAFFCIVLPSYLLLTFSFALKYADFRNLLPIFDHSAKDLITSAYKMSLTYIGFEIPLFFYPFIKDAPKSQKWAHLGVFLTTIIYTILAIVTFTYFSEDQLAKSIWATLEMWKIVSMPFVERFEYIGIANWNLIILPNICIALWGSSMILKRAFKLRQKKGVIILALFCLIAINFFDTRAKINFLNDWTGKIGFGVTYLYIPFLFIATMIVKKVKNK
ncbi:spore germination protein [Mesobacillus subterraneus]|uniref:GerAB/ArcD/ProY family transporter n=1 Tax=Mesobacillus subterraneus TaxID=285983 RepID=UPI002041B2FC|nr:GerAB/ArcD/ProY family transporter [Mesobacillus subterraneus]MCM3663374.1 spore germination protein [Mesobacillus subterraneus]MCM3683145.1 spore germination protein [Mesobacillus subterraneus]